MQQKCVSSSISKLVVRKEDCDISSGIINSLIHASNLLSNDKTKDLCIGRLYTIVVAKQKIGTIERNKLTRLYDLNWIVIVTSNWMVLTNQSFIRKRVYLVFHVWLWCSSYGVYLLDHICYLSVIWETEIDGPNYLCIKVGKYYNYNFILYTLVWTIRK